MNINVKLPKELEEKITEKAQAQLSVLVDDILKNDDEVNVLIKKTIQSQVKAEALRILQSNDMRSRMAQKVYPIIYETLGITQNGVNQ